jgi:flavin reductase (DIM6/NTAB) family NADH-FMN oxidoreductase RutF
VIEEAQMNRSHVIPVLERMVYGIYLLTTAARDERHAMVVSWVTQVSWEPLRVAVGIRKGRYAHALIPQGGNFALHLLEPHGLKDLARIKAVFGEASFDGFTIETGPSGAPIISECLGFLECALHSIVDAGDHSLFIGDVIGGALFKEIEALSTREYGGSYLGQR